MLWKYLKPALGGILAFIFCSSFVFAQSREGVLRGQITDPSAAAVPAVPVTVTDANGATKETQTDEQGRYIFRGLPAGSYTLRIHVKGFADFEKTGIVVAPGKPEVVDAQLQVAMEKQQVTVNDTTTRLSVSEENNASALVIKAKDLQSFSDDPDELEAELQALAGPAAGPNGGQIYIDGFTGGQLPPKSAILEVRVNQNPFSAEYDKLGYGRIEITTKPGASQFHGQVFADGNASAFNSRSPFVFEQPGYHSEFMDGNIGGPLSKKASFFFDGFRRDINDTSVVSAIVLSPNFTATPFSEAVLHPQSRMNLTPRLDYQVSANNVLTLRYQYWEDSGTNNGIGQFNLPSQAYNSSGSEHSIALSDTQVVSARTVNQTRFRYEREGYDSMAQSLLPTIAVIGAFTGGGNSAGKTADTQNNYELQNLTSISFGKHAFVFGGRLRDTSEVGSTTGGYNGTFTFSSIAAYQAAEQALQQCSSVGGTLCQVSGASQFVITAGSPVAKVNLVDLGLYGEDQWRARPNLSLSLGLRVETQNHISDHADFAPRVGLAWGLGGGKNPKTVLRAGVGVFYDRFQEAQVLQAERLNGINQQRYVVFSPDFFPNIPPLSTLSALASGQSSPTLYQIDPNLRAPYTIQAAVGLERQIGRNATASVTYLNSHGVHQLLARNINTPLPGTYNPADPTSGVRPYGDSGNLFQYESAGLFNQNQLISNFNVRMGTKLTLFGFYTLSYADSNTSGPNSFPMNPYDLLADYGRAAFDVRHRVFLGGSIGLPRGFRISPFMMANSGAPFNITLGQDLLGTTIYNDRPALAAPGATGPGIIATSFGAFDTLPVIGEALLPPYYGTGPGQFVLNLRLAKTFGFGRKPEGSRGPGGGGWHGPHGGGLGGRGLSSGGGGPFWGGAPSESRYNLEFSIMARNIFNMVNLGTPVGNLTSPIFGQSNSLAGGPFSSQAAVRRIDLQVRFSF